MDMTNFETLFLTEIDRLGRLREGSKALQKYWNPSMYKKTF